MADVKEVSIRLKALSADYKRGMGEASDSTNKFAKVAGVALVAAGAAAVAFAKSSADSYVSYARSIMGLSRISGENIEVSSRMAFAAQQSGVSVDMLTGGIKFLEKNMAAGNPAFATLGVNVKDASGHLRGSHDVLLDTADAISKMANGAEKTDLILKTFGRSGLAMGPLLAKGAQGIRALEAEAEKYGMVITQDNLPAINANIKAQRQLDATMQGVKMRVGAEVLPVFTAMTEAFLKIPEPVMRIGPPVLAGAAALGGMVSVGLKVSSMAKELTPKIKDLAGKIPNLGTNAAAAGVAVGGALAVYAIWNARMQEAYKHADALSQVVADANASGTYDDMADRIGKINGQILSLSKDIESSSAPWDADYRAEMEAYITSLTAAKDNTVKQIQIIDDLSAATGKSKEEIKAWMDTQIKSGNTFDGSAAAIAAYTGHIIGVGLSAEDTKVAIKAMNDETKAVVAATKAQFDPQFAMIDANKKVEDAQLGVVAADKALVDAHRGVEKAERGVVTAGRAVDAAHRGVADAERGVADAGRKVEQAHRGVEDAQRGVTTAERGLEEAHRGVAAAEDAAVKADQHRADAAEKVTAALAVQADAQRTLDDLLRGPTLDEKDSIESAAIALAEAKRKAAGIDTPDPGLERRRNALDVRRAEAALLAAQGAHDKAIVDARKALADADQAVNDARQAEIDASQNVVNARLAIADATTRVGDAERGILDARLAVVDATIAVGDAERGVVDAHIAVDDARQAEMDAVSDYVDAQGAVATAHDGVAAAERGVRDANIEVAKAATDADIAARLLTDGFKDGSVNIDVNKDALARWVQQGLITADQAWKVAQAWEAARASAEGRDPMEAASRISAARVAATPPPPPSGSGLPSSAATGLGEATINPMQGIFGHAAGGPLAAGQLSTVNELGMPELWEAGGKQYLLPVTGGRVVPLRPGLLSAHPTPAAAPGASAGGAGGYVHNGNIMIGTATSRTAWDVAWEQRKLALSLGVSGG